MPKLVRFINGTYWILPTGRFDLRAAEIIRCVPCLTIGEKVVVLEKEKAFKVLNALVRLSNQLRSHAERGYKTVRTQGQLKQHLPDLKISLEQLKKLPKHRWQLHPKFRKSKGEHITRR